MDLFDIVSTAEIPIAVVDERDRMKGIVIRGALIGALAGNDSYIHTAPVEVTESLFKGGELNE